MFRLKLAVASVILLGLALSMDSSTVVAQAKKKAIDVLPIQPKKKKGDPLVPPPVLTQDTVKDDFRIVRENGLKGDGPDLLQYFKERTLKAPDPKVIAGLVKQLGDEDFFTREKAFTSLVAMGAQALAGIKEGENNSDLEVRKRVADLKARIDTKAEPILQSAVARVIAKVKPEGAAEVLLNFLPFASDPMVIDEICKTLGAVAVNHGKVEPVIVKSLEDQVAVKRAAAGEALARAKVNEELPKVKKLLKDGDVSVRFRVCMAMMPLEDKDIVPVMIDLLGELSPNQLWPIEEALLRLAGEKAPNVALGADQAARKKCRDAWTEWYTANNKTLDMAKLTAENIFLGYTMIVQHNNRIGAGGGGNVGEIFELDKEKKVRWKVTIPVGYPVDAQVLAGNRILVAEYQANKITERDINTGEVKWEYFCGGNPFTVQRLPNGNTFIAMQGRLVEVDRNKQEVWSYQRPNNDIIRARKLPTGEVAIVANLGGQGNFMRIDGQTKNINKQFVVNPVTMLFGAMDVLPNGNVLIAHYNQQRVNEYNKDGGQIGNPINIAWPNSVVRLPNGNNLVTSYNQRQVYEFNGNQQVWNFQTDGIVFVARRR